MKLTAQTTTTRLLQGLFDPKDDAIWREFDARYRPVIYGLAMRLGLGPDDAADVAQATMVEFVRDYRRGGYDRDRGRLRAWIIGIARHQVSDAFKQRKRRRAIRGESAFAELPDDNRLMELWEAERERAILSKAMHALRATTKADPKTLQAFEMVAIQGVPAEAVALECNIEVAAVYRIKHRMTDRLRAIVTELTQAYLEGE